MRFSNKHQSGFTLIELLVVTSIISLLSSVVLVSLNAARTKARDIARIENIKNIQNALELYYADVGNYPIIFTVFSDPQQQVPNDKRTTCSHSVLIPALVPQYLAKFPTDPALVCGGGTHGLTFTSNGKDYKLVTHGEGTYKETLYMDPAGDGGADLCVLDGPTPPVHYGIWTFGARCWSI